MATSRKPDTLVGWGRRKKADHFFRKASVIVPKREEQFQYLLDLLPWPRSKPIHLLELGSGYGAFTRLLLDRYPNARVVAVDGSRHMIRLAVNGLAPYQDRLELRLEDLAFPRWTRVAGPGTFHGVLSVLTIHHLTDLRRASLYREIFELLLPGGLFLNSDVVEAPDAALEQRYERLYLRHRRALEEECFGERRSLTSIKAEMSAFQGPPKHGSGTRRIGELGTLEEHFQWLTDAGFVSVDCFWKYLTIAILGGSKPAR